MRDFYIVSFILRQMRFELLRTAVRVLAISAVIANILILEGFLAGLYDQLHHAVLRRGGDLIVTQAGVSNFIAARSILPQATRLAVEDIEGVDSTHPLTGLALIYERDGRRTPLMVVVYDTAGGPVEIVEGGPIDGDREIVIDRAVATKYGLQPGMSLELSDFEFTVAGISVNSAAFLTPFVFINYDDLIDFYFESDIAEDIATFPLLSFLIVDVGADHDPKAVAAQIEERIEVADVYLPADLAERDVGLGRELLGPILALLLVVSYGIGVLVVGMFMFATVKGRVRSLGVMKALGMVPRTLGLTVLIEAAILILVALPVGLGIAVGVAGIIQELAPVYLILAAEPAAVVRTALACLAFATIGAVLPVRTIAHVDPSLVFRS
jgi:ABC-type antimicrobial peptide transport system permease subunit